MQSISSASGWLQWLAVCGAQPSQLLSPRPPLGLAFTMWVRAGLLLLQPPHRAGLGSADQLLSPAHQTHRHTVTRGLEAFNCDIDIHSTDDVLSCSISLSSQYKNSFQGVTNTKRPHNTANFLLIKSIYKCVDIYKNEASSKVPSPNIKHINATTGGH